MLHSSNRYKETMKLDAKVNELDSQALVWNHLLGFVNSMVIKCAIKLEIIDIIGRHSRPIPLQDLAASLPVQCTNISTLRRILRYLVNMNLVAEDDDGFFSLAPASKFLMKGEEGSIVPYANMVLDEDAAGVDHRLDLGLTGDPKVPVYEKVKGASMWANASRDADRNKLFNEAMACTARLVMPGLMGALRRGAMEGIQSVVDVGGGNGTTARAVVKEFPELRYIVFDLPHVVKASSAELEGAEFVGGNMFESPLPHADAFILMRILHDWTDDECISILKRCKKALPEEATTGKVIIVDAVLGESNEPELHHARLALDIGMMAYTGGKERSEKEWRSLLKSAGFTRCEITPIKALQHVIVAARP